MKDPMIQHQAELTKERIQSVSLSQHQSVSRPSSLSRLFVAAKRKLIGKKSVRGLVVVPRGLYIHRSPWFGTNLLRARQNNSKMFELFFKPHPKYFVAFRCF
jgi:hypothetical protein